MKFTSSGTLPQIAADLRLNTAVPKLTFGRGKNNCHRSVTKILAKKCPQYIIDLTFGFTLICGWHSLWFLTQNNYFKKSKHQESNTEMISDGFSQRTYITYFNLLPITQL